MAGGPLTGQPLQLRARRTREALIEAAATVFERGGYSAATLEQVTVESGTTKGALYFHFRSKADLAQAVMQEHHERLLQAIGHSREWRTSAFDQLSKLVVLFAEMYRDDVIARAAMRIRDDYYDQLGGELPKPFAVWIGITADILVVGQADGSIRLDLDCDAAARMVSASFFGVQDMSMRLTGRDDLLERISEWWRFMTSVLAVA